MCLDPYCQWWWSERSVYRNIRYLYGGKLGMKWRYVWEPRWQLRWKRWRYWLFFWHVNERVLWDLADVRKRLFLYEHRWTSVQQKAIEDLYRENPFYFLPRSVRPRGMMQKEARVDVDGNVYLR